MTDAGIQILLQELQKHHSFGPVNCSVSDQGIHASIVYWSAKLKCQVQKEFSIHLPPGKNYFLDINCLKQSLNW